MATTHFIERHHDWSGAGQRHHQAATITLANARRESVTTNYAGPGNRNATDEQARRYRAWCSNRRFVVQLADDCARRQGMWGLRPNWA